jgi:hypothetical protein
VDSITCISDKISEAYEDHYAEVKRTRHRQLKKLQQAADKADGLELLRECGHGGRSRMQQLTEAPEQAAAEAAAEADLAKVDWSLLLTGAWDEGTHVHQRALSVPRWQGGA